MHIVSTQNTCENPSFNAGTRIIVVAAPIVAAPIIYETLRGDNFRF